MTLYDILHDFSREMTDDPNIIYNLFIQDGVEDRDIGDIWWYVIGFRDEFSIEDFRDNEYIILYTYDYFQYPKEAEEFLLWKKYTDIYSKNLVFDRFKKLGHKKRHF